MSSSRLRALGCCSQVHDAACRITETPDSTVADLDYNLAPSPVYLYDEKPKAQSNEQP